MKNTSNKERVGVIGAGSFGSAVSNILAENKQVLIYSRGSEMKEALASSREFQGRTYHADISVVDTLEEIAKECTLIFPIVPSANFRDMMKTLSPFLRPDHIMIHCTKGLDIELPEGKTLNTIETISRSQVKTMSEVMLEESVVRRIGCMAGPNLAKELNAGMPAATVVASRFDEVLREGQWALRTGTFRVHSNYDLIGIELAGVLKNIIAIAAGMVAGLGYGDNTKGMLIARGMAEMAYIGKGLGANPRSFLGMAGIGDLVATCSSPHSRNYSVGFRLAKGESLADILASMNEVAEGVKTVQITRALADYYKLPAVITRTLYKIMFEGLDVQRALRLLMEYPFTEDVEFI